MTLTTTRHIISERLRRPIEPTPAELEARAKRLEAAQAATTPDQHTTASAAAIKATILTPGACTARAVGIVSTL